VQRVALRRAEVVLVATLRSVTPPNSSDRSERRTERAEKNGKRPTDITISEVDEVGSELVEAFVRLLPQLSSSSAPPGGEELAEIVSSPSSVLFVARDADGTIVGSLTLAHFRVPTGVRAWIEDVVVDESRRGAGIGEALVAAAMDRATAEGAKSVDLTSRPSREDANRLYRRLGFEARATNIYRWSP
jgi:ribosomal protein S18 acetylase RimI-like enzyme